MPKFCSIAMTFTYIKSVVRMEKKEERGKIEHISFPKSGSNPEEVEFLRGTLSDLRFPRESALLKHNT